MVDGARVARGTRHPVPAGKIVVLGDARLLLDTGAPAPRADAADGARALEEPMQRIARLIELVSTSALPVLLLGETGVGKGHLAEQLHARSSRARGPFVRINCAALPEALLESELFGHERGAFTGAAQPKAGLFEAAHGGTIFLDEIGDVSLTAQAKLLHVMEHDEVLRLGALRARPIDVRVVAATNRDIDALVASGQFRRDLYFRLAGVPILVPPLRERRGECLALARAFLDEACARDGRPVPPLSVEARAAIAAHPWTGNIRELRNVMMRAALLSAGGEVRPEHLLVGSGGAASLAPASLGEPPAGAPRTLQSELREYERQCVLEALELFDGHRGKTAEHLGISRRTLTNKLTELDLSRARPRKRDKA